MPTANFRWLLWSTRQVRSGADGKRTCWRQSCPQLTDAVAENRTLLKAAEQIRRVAGRFPGSPSHSGRALGSTQ